MPYNYSPIISVIMPVFNSSRFLKEAIDSILDQSFSSFELLIVDDASSDSSPDIIRSYKDNRIVFLKNETNMGIAFSLNYAIQSAKGEFLARMDADDVMLPRRLEMQVKYLQSHLEVGVVGTKAIGINSDGNQFRNFFVSRTNKHIKSRLFFECSFIHPSVMLRKSVLNQNLINYDLSYSHAQDYRLWVDLSDKTEFYNLPMKLLKYRFHDSAISCKKKNDRNLQFELALRTLSEMYKKNDIMLSQEELVMIVAATLGMLCNIEQDYQKFPKVARKVMLQTPKQYSKILVLRGFAKLWVSNSRLKTWNHNSIILNIIGVLEIGLARIQRKYI
ncbi:MAG: glycosyltransferase [Clostridia bacterium]